MTETVKDRVLGIDQNTRGVLIGGGGSWECRAGYRSLKCVVKFLGHMSEIQDTLGS